MLINEETIPIEFAAKNLQISIHELVELVLRESLPLSCYVNNLALKKVHESDLDENGYPYLCYLDHINFHAETEYMQSYGSNPVQYADLIYSGLVDLRVERIRSLLASNDNQTLYDLIFLNKKWYYNISGNSKVAIDKILIRKNDLEKLQSGEFLAQIGATNQINQKLLKHLQTKLNPVIEPRKQLLVIVSKSYNGKEIIKNTMAWDLLRENMGVKDSKKIPYYNQYKDEKAFTKREFVKYMSKIRSVVKELA